MSEFNPKYTGDLGPIQKDLKEAGKKLGIEWELVFEVNETVDTCRIISDEKARQHTILLTPEVLQAPEFYKVDTYHELSHAKLSEEFDPAFSTLYFARDDSQGEDYFESPEFGQKTTYLYRAWAHVDIWVNEVRHEHWPDLTMKDIESFFDSAQNVAKSGHRDKLAEFETTLGAALNFAEMERTLSKVKRKKLEGAKSAFLKLFDSKSRARIIGLANIIKRFPELTENREENLKILETSVQDVAKYLKLPIKPRMVEQEGQVRWLV